ncbi:alpha/beta fold hydrolase [Bradyrhizobium sp. 25ACV]
MPFVASRGQRIHYTDDGVGNVVVLQHGLLLDAGSWRRAGIVSALAQRYRVLCIDSLGHGLSDKPAHQELYDQEQRAADVAAVLDDVGVERTNYIGHSMGGWLGVGVAKFQPHRLSSLAIGGWDLVAGLPKTSKGPLTYDAFMKFVRRSMPHLIDWVTPDCEPGLTACFNALGQLEGARESVLSLKVPIAIWSGESDACHGPASEFAGENGLTFLSVPGDHLGPILAHGPDTARSLAAFLDRIHHVGP